MVDHVHFHLSTGVCSIHSVLGQIMINFGVVQPLTMIKISSGVIASVLVSTIASMYAVVVYNVLSRSPCTLQIIIE